MVLRPPGAPCPPPDTLPSPPAQAQQLKKELAAAKAATPADAEADTAAQKVERRIDGGDLRRETLAFVESKSRNWLSESDVDFFTGGGPSEAADGADADVDGAEVRRRLLIGLALTAGLGAFALIPTERLAPPPSKPLFFYLVPLVRAQGLLAEAQRVIPEGNYATLQTILSRIEGPPNYVQENLRAAAASLPDARAAEAADRVARDVYEYVKGIDYQTYYESVGGGRGSRAGGGSGEKELFEFSQRSAAAAAQRLADFLALMPRDQVEAAKQQAGVPAF